MEESSEAHMETDVSSTTDDSQEVQEVQEGPGVDTFVVVETMQEDDTSPRRNKPPEPKTPDKAESVKIAPKLQEVTIKKIIIKSPIKPLQNSSMKPDMPKKIVIKYASPNKNAQLSVAQHSDDVVDSSNAPENQVSSNELVDKGPKKLTVNSDTQKSLEKDPQSHDSASTKAAKSTPTKDLPIPAKEQGSKINPTKEQSPKVSPVKDQPVKITPAKALPAKAVTVKESSTKLVSVKEPSPKSSPGKEIMGTSTPGKEVSFKTTPAKEIPSKPIPIKEIPSKLTPSKENLSKSTPTKEVPAKSTLTKEVPSKPTPIKELLSVTSTPTKEVPSKPAPNKEVPSKPTPTKEVQAPKSIIIKEISTKTPQVKESSGKLTPAKEPPPKSPSTETASSENNVETDSKIEEGSLKNKNLSILEDKEASNDSQMETNSDTSEKEHNKSISRELRSLIKSAKESKIISECNQLTSKTRKSRAPLDSSNTSLNASVEADKIQGVRRSSDNSQKSESSEKSDKPHLKRSMRSQNPEFVIKVKNFLNSVSGKTQKAEEEVSEEEPEEKKKDKDSKELEKELTPTVPKKKKIEEAVAEDSNKIRTDTYCWRCHWAVAPGANDKAHAPMHCSVCPRSFHYKCLTGTERNKICAEKSWVCPECLLVLQAESSDTRSPAMKKISLGMLCDLLRHALDRMMEVNGVEPFTQPVDRSLFPDYYKYVVHPMDLGLMRQHIADGHYGSTEAFLSDCQWILHNSIIFNTLQAKLTGGARALVRSCRAEMSEIEACPECYAAAHARRPTWFTDVCSTPHVLLWAKLKGFPYWPAKGMSVNCAGLVDVRFFGAHDRAWVPARDCFLYSEKDPNNFRTKRQDILDSMQEAEQHIRNISRKYGKFVYPPFKTQLDPSKLNEQMKMMIPSFEGEVRSAVKETPKNSPNMLKEKSRSNSKSSKGSFNDGDTSEGEENAVTSRKMADGAEIAMEEDDFSIDKDKDKEKAMEVDATKSKENGASRKRRRSDLEEAVITIMDCSKEKRKKVENDDKQEDKKDAKEENKDQTKAKESPAKPNVEPSSTPSTSTDNKSSPRATHLRVISIAKVMKNAKISPKVQITKEEDKPPAKQKKVDKIVNEKEKATPQEEKKSIKRRNSKNKSLNNSNVGKTDKAEKKNEKAIENPKEKESAASKNNETITEKDVPNVSSKDRIQFDDDTSLAVLARESKGPNTTGLPTISCVRSLSTIAGKTAEVSLASSDSSIFTPTSTDNVRNMKEAVNKLQKLRGDNDPPPIVGRVGVRAFARMTSPPERETRPNDVVVEIKTEPIDVEDSDRQMQEKMDLMKAFKLRPVNPPVNPTASLREVRINKVVVTPLNKKGAAPAQTQLPQIRPRAKKTFPQPKKADEGRSELTSKNSMVYIPIQPPMTQAPVRAARPIVTTPTSVAQRTVTSLNSNNADPAEDEGHTRKGPKYCFVPKCKNNSVKNVEKNFFTVPKAAQKPWCDAIGATCPKRHQYICEDHLNLKEDLENYNSWSLSQTRPRLKLDIPNGLIRRSEEHSDVNKPGRSISIPPWIDKHKRQTANENSEDKSNNSASNEKVRSGTEIGAENMASMENALPSIQANNHNSQLVNTMTPPLVPSSISTFTSPSTSSTMASNTPTLTVPTVGQPTTVHTMPLITSVNGQWTFSLQPVLSVGGVDGAPSPPMMNGLPERALVPIGAGPGAALMPAGTPAILPAGGPTLVPALPSTSTLRVTSSSNSDSNTPGELPRLQQRPHLMNPLDANSPMGNVPPPSTVGPLTAKLNQNAVKMTDFFRTLLEDSIEKLDEPQAQLTSLKMQLEQCKWRHQQEINEFKHNHELTLAEMRSSFEKEKVRLVADTRRQTQLELDAAVKLAKSKQWCANCNQEAQFYCCWNTSYCDYPCQRAHWAQHYAVCTQQRSQDNNGENSTNSPDGRLQQPPENLPKTTAAPNLTPGNKLAPSRVYTQEQGQGSKPSIIVSMVEDNSGNQTMKCVGTFKPPSAPVAMSPLILNKQIMSSEEAAKKVVTSGGYLIVGAPNSVPISTAMTPARRAQAIQYIS